MPLHELPDKVGPPIYTEDQAKNWVIEMTERVLYFRQLCDQSPTVKEQRKAFLQWAHYRGEALGAIQALKRTQRLSDQACTELRMMVMNTGIPTVVKGVLPFQEQSGIVLK